MSRILLLVVLLALAASPARAAVPPDDLTALVAIDFGPLAGLCDFTKTGDPAGLADVPTLVAPLKPALARFLREDPGLGDAAGDPAFLAKTSYGDLRRTVKGLSTLAYWLATKGKHAEGYRLLRHAGALALFTARRAGRPWKDGRPGGTLIGAMISVALRQTVTLTAGAILARTAPDPPLAVSFAAFLGEVERDAPGILVALRSEIEFARTGLAVLRAADPARTHTAWLAGLGGGTSDSLFPPAFEREMISTLRASPEARVVADLQFDDASREIGLYEARIAATEGKRYVDAKPVFDGLDLDFTGGRVFRNLYVQLVTPNFGRAVAQGYRQRARSDLYGLAAGLAAAAPPAALPADGTAPEDALDDGAYGYEAASGRFIVYSKARPPAAVAAMLASFRKGEPVAPGGFGSAGPSSADEGPAYRSDFGFLP